VKTPSPAPRRSGWVVLLAVAGAVLGAAFAVRASKRTRADRRALPDPDGQGAVAPARPAPASPAGKSLIWMAVGAAIIVVLALATAVVTRPSDVGRTAIPHGALTARLSTDMLSSGRRPGLSAVGLTDAGDASAVPGPMSLADCQAAIAAGLPCGYPPAGMGLSVDEPWADPSDPRYAGAALPIGLTSGGRACATGPDRPTLDTVRPVLSASFAGAPGLQRVESTFQLRGVDGPMPHDDLAGNGPPGLTAALDFTRLEPLTHGESYRWRVRGTPPSIAAGGWSQWCEFTIAMITPDDLDLDDGDAYTVVLPAAKWREILKVLGDQSTHAPIGEAVKVAAPGARRVPVTLSGLAWSAVVNGLAYWAAEDDAPAVWSLADLVSTGLGGSPHVTMGFPRT